MTPTILGPPPPRPHDPIERVVVASLGDWQVCQFADRDPRLAYFTPRGFRHLQLWHPFAEISTLTPSKLSGGAFEVWTPAARFLAPTWRDVVARIPGAGAPGEAEVRALERWFVTAHEPRQVHLLRHVWRGARIRVNA